MRGGGEGSRSRKVRGSGSSVPRTAAVLATVVLSAGVLACGGDGSDRRAREAGAASPPDGRFALDERPASEPLPDRFGVGRAATDAEIDSLDIDIMPDGTGLPPGSGSASEGAVVYRNQCASCHGMEMEGTPAGGRLVPDPEYPGFPDGTVPISARTVGNYWPYATTLFDYVRRAMPFDRPGSMSDDEVYAVTAYILAENGIVAEDAVMTAETLPEVEMPARGRFVRDDRLESDRVR